MPLTIHKILIPNVGEQRALVHKGAKILDVDYQIEKNRSSFYLWVAHNLNNDLKQITIKLLATGETFQASDTHTFFKTIHLHEVREVWHVFI